MKIIDHNFFTKLLVKIIPNTKKIFLAGDFKRIELLFRDRKKIERSIFLRNLKTLFYLSFEKLNFFKVISKKNELNLRLIYEFLISKKDFKEIYFEIKKLSQKNLLRFYRLLLFFHKYDESSLIRFKKPFNKIFELEDRELKRFKILLNNYKTKNSNPSIAVIGPLDDIWDYIEEINKYDQLLLINPSSKYNFKKHLFSDFAFYFRTPSIDAIINSKFEPPNLNPVFVILERKTKFNSYFNKFLKDKIYKLNHEKLIKNRNLIGKFNAVQSIVLHLIQMNYRNIGIYGCDLYLTSRTKNKRSDYAPYQNKINSNIEKYSSEYNHMICHEPYLNFIVLKILFEEDFLLPYAPLKEILKRPYSNYIKTLDKIISSK
tara:strand:+ start:1059 stop:2180 length:1122 start_codon:yes stop_codon:yes gene_type:complete